MENKPITTTNSYKVLNNQIFSTDKYSIVPIRYEDRMSILKWRNEQVYHLRQDKPLTELDQENYFNSVVNKLFDQEQPSQLLFSYLQGEECIGYGGLVNISWINKNAEMSFVLNNEHINDKTLYKKEFKIFIKLILKVGFIDLKLNKIFTETYDIRPFHISILESNGFILEGRMKEHILIDGEYFDSLIHACFKPL